MVGADRRKQDIINTIAYNPVNIEMDIVERVEKAGSWNREKSSITAEVRIFQEKNLDQTTISDIKGTGGSSVRYGMLAAYTEDIFKKLYNDKQIEVSFKSPYADMRISAIYPQIVKGEICGYQITLERVI